MSQLTGYFMARLISCWFLSVPAGHPVVAGKDRRIHHGINKARDCVNAVSKSKDLDFVAAFNFTVLDWVFKVMRATGVCEDVIRRLSNIYSDCITKPIINNVPGSAIRNLCGSPGCIFV